MVDGAAAAAAAVASIVADVAAAFVIVFDNSTQLGQKIGGIFPPCGVIPFRGLVLYVTPLCFLFDALEDLYVTCDV